MGLYLHCNRKDFENVVKYAKIGANNCFIGDFDVEDVEIETGRYINIDRLCEILRKMPDKEYSCAVFANWIDYQLDDLKINVLL